MNKDNAKEYLPLVQALADGKTIQFKSYISSEWLDASTHNFTEPAFMYRIKPETIELYLWYHVQSGSTCDVKSTDKETDWTSQGFRKIKVKEVL